MIGDAKNAVVRLGVAERPRPSAPSGKERGVHFVSELSWCGRRELASGRVCALPKFGRVAESLSVAGGSVFGAHRSGSDQSVSARATLPSRGAAGRWSFLRSERGARAKRPGAELLCLRAGAVPPRRSFMYRRWWDGRAVLRESAVPFDRRSSRVSRGVAKGRRTPRCTGRRSETFRAGRSPSGVLSVVRAGLMVVGGAGELNHVMPSGIEGLRDDMADKLQQFADDLIAALEALGKEIEDLVSRVLEAILEFLEDAARWFERVIKRIVEYAERFFPALGKLILAMLKLSLLYTPTLVCLLLAWFTASIGWAVGWVALGIIYAAFITLVGLSYRRSNPTRGGRHNPRLQRTRSARR